MADSKDISIIIHFNMSEIQSIERKRAIRKANRGVDTKYINEVNGLLQEEEKDGDRLTTIDLS